jgi:serine/threonine-protein kinase
VTGEIHFGQVKDALADRYIVEREIGRGGMATVYLAQDLKHNRPVAVKVLHPELATVLGPQRFLREIEITARLQHPHILPVHDSGEAGGFLFYVMPYVEGESMRDLFKRRGQLPLEEAVRFVREVAGALSYAHAREVVHRDIKPENILLSAGHAQVADFGVARAISAAGEDTITQTGAVVGTPAYMAPEQASGGGHIDGRADLYALAAVAVEALTGQRMEMFSDVTAAERALMIARPDLTHTQARALAAPLALDRANRPTTADEWLDALDAAERRPRPIKWAAAIAGAGLVGALGVWWITAGGGGAAQPSAPTIAVLPFSISGAVEDIDLAAVLPRAFEDQLRWVPDYRVLSAERVQSTIAAHFDTPTADRDTLTALVATNLSATEVLWGAAEVATSGDLRLEVQVREADTHRLLSSAAATGPLDSLHTLVASIVSEAFAERVAGARAGWDQALPKGLRAVSAYLEGETQFRRAAYDEAIERFEEVISLDSAYATAYFKRMLAEILRTQPTRATAQVRSALDAAGRYKDGLDPTTRQLLEGYEILVRDGNLDRAQQEFQGIVARHPDAVDAWFVLGYLRINFGALLGISPAASRYAFEQAHEQDPSFAAAIAQLARIAILEEHEQLGRRYMDQYLQIDSTSDWAELIRLVDTLLYASPGERLSALGSFPTRPPIVLEMLALAAGEFEQSSVDREAAHRAINSLWDRATTEADRRVAFRMRVAALLGTGQIASADTLLHRGRRRGVPRGDLDRWIVLSAATGVAVLGDPAAQAAAAARLLQDPSDDPVSLWLAARWYRGRDPGAAAEATQRLRSRMEAAPAPTPLEMSLRDDLAALDALAAGDTAGALETWHAATRRYSLEDVIFGLVGSLWPLHLDRARVAASLGDHDEVLAATASFQRMAGFVDQVAWPEVWPLRGEALIATGDVIALEELEGVPEPVSPG